MAELSFTDGQKEQIVNAIREAEQNTSGEVKVHIEKKCSTPDVMDRAKEVFFTLGLDKTQLRNGVLFYIALDDHKFAVLGDAGIDAVVPVHFWDAIKDKLREHFRAGRITEGLCTGIQMAGQQLKSHFPYSSDDVNELPDDISFQ
jgi:uncharacterized membrane protein